MSDNPFVDSAGVPWDGRSFQQNPWAKDDGKTPEVITKSLEASPFSKTAFIESLRGQRLLVPLLAEVGEVGIGPHGQLVDKSAELAIVAVATPDGRTAIPAFTCVEAMSKWNATARPVPVSIEKLCLAAVSEGHDRVVVNPGTDSRAIRRNQLAALAQSKVLPDLVSGPEVAHMLASAVEAIDGVVMAAITDGDPEARLIGEELVIEIGLRPGLSSQELESSVSGFVEALKAADFESLVDSFKLRLIAVS
ncbi:SseB family protein [Aquiluna sp.]|nr:SseB family protein [Aquiluna sp.]